MKAVIGYDSACGNTKEIAGALASGLRTAKAKRVPIAEFRISRQLGKAGATLVSQPMAFYVKGTEGPLLAGETERARNWGGELLTLMKTRATKRSA